MIGGTVLSVTHGDNELLVRVQGKTFAGTCVVPLAASNHQLSPGDGLSWQGRFAWWSRALRPPVPMERSGFVVSEQQALLRMQPVPPAGVLPS